MAHHHEHGPDRSADRRGLKLALGLTAGFLVVELVAGAITGSLALLADAGHMLSDVASLALALWATWLAGRPAPARRTFGFGRVEILAAAVNGLALAAVAAIIVIEALGRLDAPPDVPGLPLLVVAVAGLAVNLASARALHGGSSLNSQAALRHVLADALGSVGVLVAGLLILTTGWTLADPLVSLLVAVLVALGAVGILRDATRVLLEDSPAGIDPEEVGRAMATTPGVVEVHDLHVWTITSGFPALAAHVTVEAHDDCHLRRRQLSTLLRERYGIAHTTLQVDHERESRLIELEPANSNVRPGP